MLATSLNQVAVRHKGRFRNSNGYHVVLSTITPNVMNFIISNCRVLVFVVFMSALPPALAEQPCSRTVPVHGHCEVALSVLHPTQSAIGLMQVEERAMRTPHGLDGVKYTSKRPVPIVQAPNGAFYVTDGHHLVSTLLRSGSSKVMAEIIGRFDNPKTFWSEMQSRQWVYLYDIKGNPIPPSALPKRFADLADDPYRALAGYAEEAGYFRRSDVYFAEFHWARYFGSKMGWQPVDRMNLLSALQTAEKLACLPDASDLPGYAGPCGLPH